MARPIKDGIDYFPMDIDFFSDMKVRRIKKACGPASVSILICLLCNIYRDGYYILWNEDLTFFISEIIGVTEGVVLETILKAVSVGFFNGAMFSQHKILTSTGIQKRFMNVVKASKLKRNSIIPEYDLTQTSEEMRESSEGTPISSEETPINPEESTQSKVKQSKAKKSIIPPISPVDELDEPLLSAMQEFITMRKQIKAPMSNHAIKLTISELEKLAPGDGKTQIAILNQSIQRGWKGVFALKSDKADKQPGRLDHLQNMMEVLEG